MKSPSNTYSKPSSTSPSTKRRLRLKEGDVFKNPNGRWRKVMSVHGNSIGYNSSGCIQRAEGSKHCSRDNFLSAISSGNFSKTKAENPFTI